MKVSTLVAFVAVVAVGCGANNNPKRYEMAIDASALAQGTFPSSCISSTPEGTDKITLTDNRFIWEYEIWTAADGKTFELTTNSANLKSLVDIVAQNVKGSGNKFNPEFDGTIESTDGKTFKLSYNQVATSGSATLTDASTITITFADTSYAKGSISVTASRDCTVPGFCVDGEKFTCSPAALPFVATQITGNNQINFN